MFSCFNCRGKYLFHRVTEGVTQEFYRQLYPNIIRDIDVSSYIVHALISIVV